MRGTSVKPYPNAYDLPKGSGDDSISPIFIVPLSLSISAPWPASSAHNVLARTYTRFQIVMYREVDITNMAAIGIGVGVLGSAAGQSTSEKYYSSAQLHDKMFLC